MHLLVQLCNKYLTCFHYGPDILKKAKHTRVNKVEVATFMELTFYWSKITLNRKTNIKNNSNLYKASKRVMCRNYMWPYFKSGVWEFFREVTLKLQTIG